MNSIKEDSSYFNNAINESLQQNREETTSLLNELFEAKNYQNEDSKPGSNNYKMNTIKKVFNKQIKSYVLSINEGQINSKQHKVQLQINNLKAQTLVFQVYVNKISLNITAVTSKNQVLRLKIFPGAKCDINTSNIQQTEQNIGNGVSTSTSTAQTTAINTNRKPKSDECLPGQQVYLQTQETVYGPEDTVSNTNGNGTVAFKQIFPYLSSQDNKFNNCGEDLVFNSQEKSLSFIVGNSQITQNQQQKQNNNVNNNSQENNFNSQGSSFNPTFVFYVPSDFLVKDKWINLIVDLKSFFKEVSDDFVVKSIQIGQQCRLKSIFYSQQSDLNTSILGQNESLAQGGSNKFIPQLINNKLMSQTFEEDNSPVFVKKRKSQCNHINFLQPNAINSTYISDKNNFHVDSSQIIQNSTALPSKTPNKQNRYQNRYSGHLSNYKHSQVAQYVQSGSSKSHPKQPPPPLSQNQSPSAVSAAIVQSTSASCSHTNTNNIYTNSTQVSKLMRRRESKNIYSGNSNQNYNNNSFQQQAWQNNQSLQYNQQQQSYLSSNVSFEQQPSTIIHSHIPNTSNAQNTQQNILYHQSTSQSTHPNCAQFSDEDLNSKMVSSGPYTQRTSSLYFCNVKRSNRSNICGGFSQQPQNHGNFSQQYQSSHLNNSVSVVGSNSYNLNGSNNNGSNKNNSIRLPKIISLLKQRSSSIYSGVTNRSHQITEELDVNGVQSISNINSARRTKDIVRNYNGQIQNKSPNGNNTSYRNNNNLQNFSSQHKTKVQNKIQTGLEALLIQNEEIKNLSPSKNEMNSARTQQIYRQSQQRFNTMSLVQSPRNYNHTQNTVPNFDIIPNEASTNQLNLNDLYNIADQAQSKIQDGEIKSEMRSRSEEDEDTDKKNRDQNNKASVMNKLSSVITTQNKENDPRYRNTLAQKQEMQINLANKRRSSLFSTSTIKNEGIQKNSQTINSINTTIAKGSLYTSRRMNRNSYQEQTSPLQYQQYNTQQSFIQNDEDQINIDSSQCAYYAPKHKKSKGSQSPSQIVSSRNGSISIKKRRQSSNNNNKNNQMSILNSPQQQSSDQQQKSYVRNSYSIVNKKSNPKQKQNSAQKGDQMSNIISEKNEVSANEQYNNAIQNEKIEKKRKIIMQQQQQNKDNYISDNTKQYQYQQKIGQSRANYHQSPPGNKNSVDNSLDISQIQDISKISLIPQHILQNSIQAQLLQTNNSSTLQASNQISKDTNQAYQPQQLTQLNQKKQQQQQQQQNIYGSLKQNSRNQSPQINNHGLGSKYIQQNIVYSNSSNNTTSVKLETKRNSVERTSNLKQTPRNTQSHSQPTTQSPPSKKCVQKSNFCQQAKPLREDKNQQIQDLQELKSKNKQQIGQNNQKQSPTTKQDYNINNDTSFVVKTEEVPDNTANQYLQKNKPRKISDAQQKSTSRGRGQKSQLQNNQIQQFSCIDTNNSKQQNNQKNNNYKNEQVQQKNKETKEIKQQTENQISQSKVVEQIEDESQITEKNDQFSSSFNDPSLSQPLAFFQKNVEILDNKNKSPTNQLPQTNTSEKLNFQIGFLKSPKTLTASNIKNMNDNPFEIEHIAKQDKDQLNAKESNPQEKIFIRKYQRQSSKNKVTKNINDNDIKLRNSRSLVEISREIKDDNETEELIELQKSECIPTLPDNQNNSEEIEEKIEQNTLTEQSKSIQEQHRKELASSGSVYQSENITSDEEECNESGLAISIQVDNIDLKEINDLQTIIPQNKKQQSSINSKETSKTSKENNDKRKQQSGNKFIQEIERQISSCHSIEVSRVVIVQDDDNDDDQNVVQIKSQPYNTDWRIQSYLIENNTDILKNRNNLKGLIKGKDQQLQTIQILATNTADQNLNQSQKNEFQKQNQLTDNKQLYLSKKFMAPQILQLNEIVKVSD